MNNFITLTLKDGRSISINTKHIIEFYDGYIGCKHTGSAYVLESHDKIKNKILEISNKGE